MSWWQGHKDISGRIHVSRSSDILRAEEARMSPLCDEAVEPFKACSKKEARKIIEEKTSRGAKTKK